MGQQPSPQSQRARTALPPGLRPVLDTLRTDDANTTVPEKNLPGLELLRHHLADYAPQTRRAYLTDWKRWAHWCHTHDRDPLPANPADVALYLAHAHDDQNASPTTVQRWATTIATTHIANGHPDPTNTPPVPGLLRWLRQTKPQPRRRTSRWLTDMELTRVLAHTRGETWPELVINRRDRLAMLLTRATGDGPDEILSLRTGQLDLDQDTVILTHQDREPQMLANPLPAADWTTCLPCSLVMWRQVLDLADDSKAALRHTLGVPDRLPSRGHLDHALETESDPEAWLLRRVRRGGTVTADRMTPKALRELLHTHASGAGIDTTGLTAFALRPRP
ncbi:site-specific integrase [Nocardiopsis sp. FR6]|uniref:site-specific integrase n=1 Tax=Nocardiopsis sp. FR6 TaxID=2605986 RepID=UPI001F376979|nr:site-specific integrase [Nocardiopsis sp. FR6]